MFLRHKKKPCTSAWEVRVWQAQEIIETALFHHYHDAVTWKKRKDREWNEKMDRAMLRNDVMAGHRELQDVQIRMVPIWNEIITNPKIATILEKELDQLYSRVKQRHEEWENERKGGEEEQKTN
mgnify:CR=1 FL=1